MIGDIAKVKGGKRLPKGKRVQDEATLHPYLRVVDFSEDGFDPSNVKYIDAETHLSVKRYIISENDVYISIAGTIGRVGIVPKEFSGANLTENAAKITGFSPEYDKKFLMYFLRSDFGQAIIGSKIVGTSQPKLALFRIKEIKVPLLEKRVQQKIAAILSVYDDLIENNLRRVKILEEMAQNLYHEWFVKFRFPGHEQAHMVDSAMGKIPEGWEIKPFGELLKHSIGGGWGKDDQDDKHTLPAHVIRGTDIPGAKHGQIDSVPFRYHTASNLKSRRLCAGDIVFEVSGGSKDQPVGRALLVNDSILRVLGGDTMCASFCKLVRPNQEVISSFQLYLHIEEIYEDRRIMEYQTQSTGISNLKFSVFAERELVLLPVPDVRAVFDQHLEEMFGQIANLGERNRNLRQTRDLLLPKLISGEMDVSELEIDIGEAA